MAAVTMRIEDGDPPHYRLLAFHSNSQVGVSSLLSDFHLKTARMGIPVTFAFRLKRQSPPLSETICNYLVYPCTR